MDDDEDRQPAGGREGAGAGGGPGSAKGARRKRSRAPACPAGRDLRVDDPSGSAIEDVEFWERLQAAAAREGKTADAFIAEQHARAARLEAAAAAGGTSQDPHIQLRLALVRARNLWHEGRQAEALRDYLGAFSDLLTWLDPLNTLGLDTPMAAAAADLADLADGITAPWLRAKPPTSAAASRRMMLARAIVVAAVERYRARDLPLKMARAELATALGHLGVSTGTIRGWCDRAGREGDKGLTEREREFVADCAGGFDRLPPAAVPGRVKLLLDDLLG